MAFFESAKPIRVDGGILARRRRGSIGEEWWSRRFIDLLEAFADTGRLQRGRAYARQGQVLRLDIRPYEVTAIVQGSRPEPYEVTLGLQAIDGWDAIEEELSRRAVFRARLLAGEMPREIEQVFDACGVALFPEHADDLALMCSCPDWGTPCKHAAAALYLLAEAFDDDPFLILAWNGRARDDLLTALRRRPLTPEPGEDEDDDPLTAEDFWTPPSGLAALRDRPPVPTTPPGLLLQLLDPPDIKIRRRQLADVLLPLYVALAADGPEESTE
ncbi:SWIM zinc finger family protein [Actinocorallia longicatena]|uniref:SWIM zinc finger family protein n=1 Tax=Actinocorallia longicatena TaxID=111803 RepID=A0ABP6Q2G2_9ACTN